MSNSIKSEILLTGLAALLLSVSHLDMNEENWECGYFRGWVHVGLLLIGTYDHFVKTDKEKE